MATIFIIEDDAQFLMLMRKKLRLAGYDVMYASDGAEALQKYEAERPDLVLLDMILPDIEGLALLKKIQEVKKAPPVIALTNYDDSKRKHQVQRLNADYFIKSEVEIADVMDRIKMLLKK